MPPVENVSTSEADIGRAVEEAAQQLAEGVSEEEEEALAEASESESGSAAEEEAGSGGKSAEEGAEETAEGEGGEEVKAEEAEEADKISAPEHWPEDIRAAFERVDRATQEAWLTHDKQFQRGFDELSQKHKEAERTLQDFAETRQVLQQFEPYWRAQGMSVAQGVGQLTQWAFALAQNPREVLPELARMYGIDLGELASQAPYMTPEEKQAQGQIQQIGQRMAQMENRLAEQNQTQLVGQIEAFRNEKDADGNLLHPYFDDVVDEMIGMYERGYQGSTADAYEQACWLNPDVRQQLIANVKKESRNEVALQRSEQAKRAKSASQQRVRKSQPASGDPTLDDLSDDDLIAHLAQKQVANA